MKQHERLLERAAEYRRKAEALELAVQELNGHAITRAVASLPGKVARATKMLRRSEAQTKQQQPRRKSSYYTPAVKAKREKSAALLKKIAEAGGGGMPKNKVGTIVGALVRRGYVERVGDVYVRTSKEYVV